MQLSRFGYKELVGMPGEWTLEPFSLQQTNLIVGRNSTGKSRTLNVIAGLARLILGGEAISDGDFEASFTHEGSVWEYNLRIEGSRVVDERLHRDKDMLIDRSRGLIWSSEYSRHTRFKMRDNQIAVNAKLDLIQTPFLEPLNKWADSVFHFHFGSALGQTTMTFPVSGPLTSNDVNVKDENQTAQIYRHGYERFRESFDEAIVADMRRLNYDIDYVGLGDQPGLRPQPQLLLPLLGMHVHEAGIDQPVGQHMMSTGMFRALAIIIHVNLGILTGHAELILLDDVGEGLDFERSTRLIKLLVEKVNKTNTQVILTSNDRFIMNAVDVDYWTVLSREGNRVRAFNRESSPEAFEDFKFSGLQNFDFFSMDLATENSSPKND
ncbi:AAA family ATPase [Rhizobium sp. MHM7A]|uniref:AAA family ATPase n=1 Tax=Rhizobium sp. MHM7A TaxID=2583233 RepID=UPI001106F1F1|nr:AAA family ATPase [Rhizobium sp. MHM7A]TLX12076.1 ATP-binding protein [Rhizobium sp. MHM7A]